MSQFFSTSIYELRHNKCKKIIEELEALEKNYINKIKCVNNDHQKTDNPEIFRNRTISPHYIKNEKLKYSGNLNSSIDEIIPKYFIESENFIEEQEGNIRIQKNNEDKKFSALKCFEKLRFILSGISHIIHYNSIPFELENYINPENEIAFLMLFRPKYQNLKYFKNMTPSIEFSSHSLSLESNFIKKLKKFSCKDYSEIFFSRELLYIYYYFRFLNELKTEEQIKSKKNTLENYFCWKAKKWIRSYEKKNSNKKIKCKICIQDVPAQLMNKHSELCISKKQLSNEIKILKGNFGYFVAISENIIRTQKTLYRIEK